MSAVAIPDGKLGVDCERKSELLEDGSKHYPYAEISILTSGGNLTAVLPETSVMGAVTAARLRDEIKSGLQSVSLEYQLVDPTDWGSDRRGGDSRVQDLGDAWDVCTLAYYAIYNPDSGMNPFCSVRINDSNGRWELAGRNSNCRAVCIRTKVE